MALKRRSISFSDDACNGALRRAVKRYPTLDGLPVFKDRLGYGNVGKRGGARVIYYCDDGRVVPLFVYVKAKDADIPAHEIRAALAAASSMPAPDPE